MRIAGRPIKAGDVLYHKSLGVWGVVQRIDRTGSAVFEIKNGSRKRELVVQDGGRIFGKRQLYWHEPIKLDIPQQDIAAVQRIVDAVAGELYPSEEAP